MRRAELARLIERSEEQLTKLESRLGELELQEKQLRQNLEARHGAITALLASMQRMGRNPPPVMSTGREDALSMVRSAMLLAAAFPELKGQVTALTEKLGDLLRVKESIHAEAKTLGEETSRLNDARIRLDTVDDAQCLASQSGGQTTSPPASAPAVPH